MEDGQRRWACQDARKGTKNQRTHYAYYIYRPKMKTSSQKIKQKQNSGKIQKKKNRDINKEPPNSIMEKT